MKQNLIRQAHTRAEEGFILVLTLWVLVIVTIVVGYFAERVARSVELAQQARQNIQSAIDLSDTRAEILYRLGTTSITAYGLGNQFQAIALDNRPYRSGKFSMVRLQDNRGLLNLNLAGDDRIRRILGILGIPADRHGRMIDTLRDYIDDDDLVRLNGAEKDDYLAAGLAPPGNNRLITPWEAQKIIAWSDNKELWESGQLAALTTTSLSAGINPNTAPWQVLATLPGVTDSVAQAIIAQRQLLPILGVEQITNLTGGDPQPLLFQVITLPSDAVRVTQSAAGLPWAIQYNVRLTPNDNEKPWRIDYQTKTELPDKHAGVHPNTESRPPTPAIPELPPRSTAPPNSPPAFLTGL